MAKILDANAILRYLLNDIPKQADEAAKAIDDGASTISEVVPELVYVLDGVYKLDRITIKNTLSAFLDEIDLQDKLIVKTALDLYSKKNLDYVDCVLAARHQLLGDDILSFDKALTKLLR